jgi:DNA-directed RNA polymerase subunit M/transcription elongation factor TFIIS
MLHITIYDNPDIYLCPNYHLANILMENQTSTQSGHTMHVPARSDDLYNISSNETLMDFDRRRKNCRVCGSDDLINRMISVRSGDEAPVLIRQCKKCHIQIRS